MLENGEDEPGGESAGTHDVTRTTDGDVLSTAGSRNATVAACRTDN